MSCTIIERTRHKCKNWAYNKALVIVTKCFSEKIAEIGNDVNNYFE